MQEYRRIPPAKILRPSLTKRPLHDAGFSIPGAVVRGRQDRTSTGMKPRIARLEQAVRDAADRCFPHGARVLIACSGGADSVALLRAWERIAAQRGDFLAVAHFNHLLRPEAAQDRDFVAELARGLGLPFITADAAEIAIPGTRKRTVEEAARLRRYRFLERSAREIGCAVVATAHTSDDQVETVLHAMLRGTGLRGLAGMRPIRTLDLKETKLANPDADQRKDGLRIGGPLWLFRPLLQVSRRDVEAWLAELKQPFRTDSTNADERFTRNRIRRVLLPMLRQEFNPRVDEAILRLAEHAAGAETSLRRRARRLLARSASPSENPSILHVRIPPLRRVGRSLAGQAMLELLDLSGWPRAGFGQGQVARLVDQVRSGAPRRTELPGKISAELVEIDGVPMLRLERHQGDCIKETT